MMNPARTHPMIETHPLTLEELIDEALISEPRLQKELLIVLGAVSLGDPDYEGVLAADRVSPAVHNSTQSLLTLYTT
jgi:hypothetical protein